MKTDSKLALQRASDCLSDARYCLADGRTMVAANRAYYCIFDCLRALLFDKEILAKTHSGVQSKFRELYVKTGLFSLEMNEMVTKTFEMREFSDYDLSAEIDEEDAEFCIKAADAFLIETNRFFYSKQA